MLEANCLPISRLGTNAASDQTRVVSTLAEGGN
jgi:hypothetical protein